VFQQHSSHIPRASEEQQYEGKWGDRAKRNYGGVDNTGGQSKRLENKGVRGGWLRKRLHSV